MAKNSRAPLVIVGPSGVGKSTLINALMSSNPNRFQFSVSHTTRKSRPKEEHGVHYLFVEKDYFSRLVKRNKFIEHFEVHGNLYGTSKDQID